jgi:hypothetical protein
VDRFEAAPLAGFVGVGAGASLILAGALLALSRRHWRLALAVPGLGAVLAVVRGTHPGPLRVNLLVTAVVFVSFAVALAAQRRALVAGYRPEMKGRFMRALAPAEQRRFMLVFASCALLLAAVAIGICVALF